MRAVAQVQAAEPWVSVEKVAVHLGVAKDSVYRWIDAKGLPAHRIGKLWKFKLSEVDDWVRAEGAKRGAGASQDCAPQLHEEEEMTAAYARASTKTIPMLFTRQRQLLQLLDALGGSAAKLDFQKLLFLYCQEPASGAPYDFVPYKFGAFSFTSYADRRKLIERGLLVDTELSWQITDDGRRAIGRTGDMMLTAFAKQYRALRGDDLVAATYRRYPYFATRSEIVERVLKGDRDALARVASARVCTSGRSLQTIGYEGHTLESYLNLLLKGGISVLCDVRRNPISRKYGFSKSTLARGCEGVGICYEHLPELGIASDQRQGLETQADYDLLFAEYERTSLPMQADALKKIQAWVDGGERVALTCFEHLPHQCHRHCVAEALEARFGKAFSATHL